MAPEQKNNKKITIWLVFLLCNVSTEICNYRCRASVRLNPEYSSEKLRTSEKGIKKKKIKKPRLETICLMYDEMRLWLRMQVGVLSKSVSQGSGTKQTKYNTLLRQLAITPNCTYGRNVKCTMIFAKIIPDRFRPRKRTSHPLIRSVPHHPSKDCQRSPAP